LGGHVVGIEKGFCPTDGHVAGGAVTIAVPLAAAECCQGTKEDGISHDFAVFSAKI
jgi:hypothetical protein